MRTLKSIPMSSSPSSHSEVQLSKNFLLTLLTELSILVIQEFSHQIRLLIHGGTVMILHPNLSTSSSQWTTRDIDYICCAFGHEWWKQGIYDTEECLQHYINAVATKFCIGYVNPSTLSCTGHLSIHAPHSTSWMNANPNIALPFTHKWVIPQLLFTHLTILFKFTRAIIRPYLPQLQAGE
jgi:hypothetical protein